MSADPSLSVRLRPRPSVRPHSFVQRSTLGWAGLPATGWRLFLNPACQDSYPARRPEKGGEIETDHSSALSALSLPIDIQLRGVCSHIRPSVYLPTQLLSLTVQRAKNVKRGSWSSEWVTVYGYHLPRRSSLAGTVHIPCYMHAPEIESHF